MAAKTEVYTWRVSSLLKSRLEDAAREHQRSVAQMLDEIVTEGLENVERHPSSDAERQRRLHKKARAAMGRIAGGSERRSEHVRELVRARLMKKRRRRAT